MFNVQRAIFQLYSGRGFKYEKEKRPEFKKRIFNAKWCEGRSWLKYDRDGNVMTCTKGKLEI